MDINEIIYNNTGLVYKQLSRFNLTNDQDAESLSFEALYNAAVGFEPDKGVKFSTYATVCIYNAIGCYLRAKNRQRRLDVVSYNVTVDSTGDEYLDLLPGENDSEETYLKKELYQHIRAAFNKHYDKLANGKQRDILTEWKKSDFTSPTVEIAKKLGMSQSYVSQVINRFKYVLRKELEDYNNV